MLIQIDSDLLEKVLDTDINAALLTSDTGTNQPSLTDQYSEEDRPSEEKNEGHETENCTDIIPNFVPH